MSRAELIKAFEMKADGYTYKWIGRRLGSSVDALFAPEQETVGRG